MSIDFLTIDFLLANMVALGSVIILDLVLAGDNAVVIGMAANRVTPQLRARAIAFGIVLATLFRITFAIFAAKMLTMVGLLLIGGLLLLWVAWRLWRDITEIESNLAMDTVDLGVTAATTVGFWGAIYQITLADITMSLDNVLAVAGTGRHNPTIMAFGLVLSIALMGAAAAVICGMLDRYRWLNYAGLTIIVLVAFGMIYDGAGEVLAMALPDRTAMASGR